MFKASKAQDLGKDVFIHQVSHQVSTLQVVHDHIEETVILGGLRVLESSYASIVSSWDRDLNQALRVSMHCPVQTRF